MRWVASNTDPAGNTGFLGWVTALDVDGSTTLTRRFVEDQPVAPGQIVVEFGAPTSSAPFRLLVTDTADRTLAEKHATLAPGPVPAPEHATFNVPPDGIFLATLRVAPGLYLEELVVDTGKVNAFGVTVDRVRALASHVSVDGDTPVKVDAVFGGGLQRKIRATDVQAWIEDVSAVVELRLSKRSKLTEQAQKDTLTNAAAAIIATGAAAYLVDAAFPANASTNDSGSYGQVLWSRYRTDLEALVEQVDEWTDVVESEAGGGSGGAAYFPPPAFPDTLRW